MGGSIRAFLAAMTFACGGSSAGAASTPSTPAHAIVDAGAPANTTTTDVDESVPADLRAQVRRAQRVGQLLVALDRPAEYASEIAEAQGARTDVIGYLTIVNASSELQVNFYVHEHPLAIGYRVVFPHDGKPAGAKVDPPEAATAGEEKLFRARQAVSAKLVPPQPQHYDAVVLPASLVDEPGILVYLLASASQDDTAVFGKHYRARTSEDGSHVLEFEPLSNGAIELPLHPTLPPGATPVGMTLTQVLTDYPVETHVFQSLVHHMPVYVATARGLWKVDGAAITFEGKLRSNE